MQLFAIAIACILAAVCFCGCGSPQPEPEPLPYWATFFEAGEFEQFKAEVRRQLDLKDRPYTFNVAEGTVIYDDKPGLVIGLHNLAQYCNSLEPKDWSSEVEGFLRKVESASVDRIRNKLSTGQARKMLRIRLQPLDRDVPDDLVSYPICKGFHTMLVLDEPDKLTYVLKSNLKEWKLDQSEAWRIATANLAKDPKPMIKRIERDGYRQVFTVNGESLLTTSHLLDLERLFKDESGFGFLVTVPASNGAFVAPIKNAESIHIVAGLKMIAEVYFKEGPASISDQVFWVRKNKWVGLDVAKEGENYVLTGPKLFKTEVIAKLPPN